jgi:hypothetical protein
MFATMTTKVMPSRSFAVVVLIAASSVGVGTAQEQRGELYTAATLGSDGDLHITTTNGREIVVPKSDDNRPVETQQAYFEKPELSINQRAVGSRAFYRNCCTSYEIPLALVVYADGRTHRFTGSGLPIFLWHFADAGTLIAFGQEPVHFGCSVHYELREIRSERLVDSADVPEPCGQDPNPQPVKVPDWVNKLEQSQRNASNGR